MSKSKSIRLAEAALKAKSEEVKAALEALAKLESEYKLAFADLERAKQEQDEKLPRCKIVRISHIGDRKEALFCEGVICRKTPTGILVVRSYGSKRLEEMKFSFSKNSGHFSQFNANSGLNRYTSHLELRDVPAEFFPA